MVRVLSLQGRSRQFDSDKGYQMWHRCKFPYSLYEGRKVQINGRTYVHLRHLTTKHQRITSLARYRMSVHLKRALKTHEQVDHRDEDRTNDTLSNLQLLTGKSNTRKSVRHRKGLIVAEMVQRCEVCPARFKHQKLKRTCGRVCKNRLLATVPRTPRVDATKIKRLRRQGGTSYSIADTLGISRNTVMKHW